MARTYFFWDPLSDNILQERDGSGAVAAEYTTEPGLYGNLISQNRGGVESQYHFDALGSTLALTDDNQQVTDTYAYTAFGEVTEQTGGTTNPFQHIGQLGYYTDTLTNDCFVRRRALAADFGVWRTADPLTLLPHVLRRYLYVDNNPITRSDPSGLELKHEPIGSKDCSDAALKEIEEGLKEACRFVSDARGVRCLPADLKDCLAKVCDGTVFTKCIKECDPKKDRHMFCARAQVTKDKKSLSDPVGDTRCKSSVPEGSTPVIEFCYTNKGAPGTGFSNPKKCEGAAENVMQMILHELMHFCGAKHKLDARDRPIEKGDLVFGCMRRCFQVGGGDEADCTCC